MLGVGDLGDGACERMPTIPDQRRVDVLEVADAGRLGAVDRHGCDTDAVSGTARLMRFAKVDDDGDAERAQALDAGGREVVHGAGPQQPRRVDSTRAHVEEAADVDRIHPIRIPSRYTRFTCHET